MPKIPLRIFILFTAEWLQNSYQYVCIVRQKLIAHTVSKWPYLLRVGDHVVGGD